MPKKQIVTVSLIEFCAQAEKAAQPRTVCRITHPDAIDGDVFEGTYAGYPLVSGPVAEALLSDGSFIPLRPAVALKNGEAPEPQPEQTQADPLTEGGAQ